MRPLARWLRRWGAAIVMMLLIFTASGTPGNDLPQFGIWDIFAKKGGHLIGYALLGVAWLRGLAYGQRAERRTILLAVALSTCYAATDEFHQSFIPLRTPSPVDVGIDTIGAIIGVLLWTRIKASPLYKRASE